MYLATVTTAFFEPSGLGTGSLAALRSVWKIDSTNKKARLLSFQQWGFLTGWEWIPVPREIKVSAGHRSTLASFLMYLWDMGKLRGRITATRPPINDKDHQQ